ncbi:unnamed protein product [Angiostrongylus costaricensis]|uniref:Uncharacterized protein n=1 Tax=Angiostrongylus costaricensis TaxID=334426 RepID=A0A0R3PYT8_ANGCS|nr:unnamed protein product [Angiostrongylus costaricensis]
MCDARQALRPMRPLFRMRIASASLTGEWSDPGATRRTGKCRRLPAGRGMTRGRPRRLRLADRALSRGGAVRL